MVCNEARLLVLLEKLFVPKESVMSNDCKLENYYSKVSHQNARQLWLALNDIL